MELLDGCLSDGLGTVRGVGLGGGLMGLFEPGSDHGRCTGVVEYPGGGTGVSDRGVRGYVGDGC